MFSKELLNSDIFSLLDNIIAEINIEITAKIGINVIIEILPKIKNK